MKRILSVFLALVLALGLLTVGASALNIDLGAEIMDRLESQHPGEDDFFEFLDEKGYSELISAVQSYIDEFLSAYYAAACAANAANAASLAEFEDRWDDDADLWSLLDPAGRQYLRGLLDQDWGVSNTLFMAGGGAYQYFDTDGGALDPDDFDFPSADAVITAIKASLGVALQAVVTDLEAGLAPWTPVSVTGEMSGFSAFLMTYEPNGSGSDPLVAYKQYLSTFAAAAATAMAAPAGKQFKQWNTLADGTGTAYAAGANVTMPARALSLYAIWEDIPTYAVTYDLNGGTGTAPAEAAKAAGATFAAAAATGLTAPAGKQFTQWNTLADGTGTAYAPGAAVIMPAGVLTLYAIWDTIPTYPVAYSLNGGTGTAPTEAAKAAGATFAAAAATGLTAPAGKQFKQWNTLADGAGTAYAPGAVVTMPTGALTLYAIWENIPTYNLTYNLNYPGAPILAPLAITANTDFSLVNTYNREGGYYFKGWSLTATGVPIAGQKVKMTGDITVYAVWEKIDQLYHVFTRILPASMHDGLLHNFLYYFVKYVCFGWLWQGWVWK